MLRIRQRFTGILIDTVGTENKDERVQDPDDNS
jgi:hypothetical protein